MTRRARAALAAVCAVTFAMAATDRALAGQGRLGGGGDLDVSLGRIVAALVVSIIVAVLAALLIRQRRGRSDLRTLFARFELRPRAIEVVETRRLSPHADICVVRHGGRQYLLLLMAGASQLLSESSAEALPDQKA